MGKACVRDIVPKYEFLHCNLLNQNRECTIKKNGLKKVGKKGERTH